MTIATLLLIFALVSFLLAAFGASLRVGASGTFSFRDLGFAFVTAAFLAPML